MRTPDGAYLYSSIVLPKARLFQGYCFVGNDFIYGETGACEYERKIAKPIEPGEDGCYLVVDESENGYRFGADFAGYKKIFYYHDGAFWLVTNSITLAIEHLREAGRAPQADEVHLAAAGMEFYAIQQLAGFETPVRGLHLLPSSYNLYIGAAGVELRRRTGVVQAGGYEEALADFIEVTVSRVETILADGRIGLSVDLTGGIDSRTVLAVILRALDRLGQDNVRNWPAIKTVRHGGNEADFGVSNEILAHINESAQIPLVRLCNGTGGSRMSPKDAFLHWFCLYAGNYNVVHLPLSRTSPFKIALGGAGGECVRKFYGKHFSGPEQLSSYSASRMPQHYRSQFEEYMLKSFEHLRSIDPELPPLIHHYREFRARFHGGIRPQNAVGPNLLGSQFLIRAARWLDSAMLDAGKALYDVIHATSPDLLAIRFDSPAKNPTADITSKYPTIELGQQPSPGRVFMGDRVLELASYGNPLTNYNYLRQKLDRAAQSQFVQDFWGAEFIAMTKGAAVSSAGVSAPISGVLLAHKFA